MAVKNYHLYLAAKEHSLLMIYVGGIESIPNIYICVAGRDQSSQVSQLLNKEYFAIE